MNVTAGELAEEKDRIARLMLPRNTLMDITISSALWFACRYVDE